MLQIICNVFLATWRTLMSTNHWVLIRLYHLTLQLLRQSPGAGGHRKNRLLISRTPLADFLESNQDFSEDRLLSSRFLRDSAIYLQKIRAKKIQQAVSQKSADSASGLPKSPDCFAKNPRAGCEKSAIYFSGARLPPAIVWVSALPTINSLEVLL